MLNEKQILEKRARVHNTMKDLIARAEKEGRAMSADESNQWDAANKDFDDLTGQLEKVRRMEEIEAGIPSHVTADLNARPQLTGAELRERMSGNICRCGAYSNIQEAIAEVAGVKA